MIAEQLVDCIKTFITESKVTERIKIRKSDKVHPWDNWKIYKAIKAKEKARKKWKSRRWNQHYRKQYVRSSNRLKCLIKREKNNYIQRKASEKDPKKLWRNLNEIMGRKKKQEITSIRINGSDISDPKIIAHSFNDFFIDSIKSLCTDLADCPSPRFKRVTQTMILRETDNDEISLILNELKNSAAPGFDGVKSIHIKKT